jgi:replicative DNA helicase
VANYKQRKIVEALQKALSDAVEHESETVVEDLMDNLSRIEEQTFDDDDGHISKVLLKTAEWMETDHGEISGAPTGFSDLDKLTSGLQRQDLVIVGGRPSMGKTAFSVGACLNYAEDKVHGGPVAMFSLEMRNHALALRMISNVAHIEGQSMFNPINSFTDEEWSRSTNAFGQLGNLRMHMFDDPGINIAFIRNKLRLMQRLYPGQHVVVMIDYLQLIQGDPKHKGNRTQEISDISRSLKRLAREMDMTIIALAQLSRGVESRQDKRPMLSDLRESGQLEQDADVIAFLYRDDYYDKESESKNLVEIIVAKQRNGPVGTVSLAFVKEFSKFVNIAKK